ncbi:MAG: phage virion morphogenesis protein [Myxococcota bacterium]
MTLRTRTRGFNDARAMVGRIAGVLDELRPAVGRAVVQQTRERIAVEKSAPSGARWLRRRPSTLRRYGRITPTLERTGRLLRSITFRPTPTGVVVGSAVPYARRINRRRPFLGLSRENVADLKALVVRVVEAQT